MRYEIIKKERVFDRFIKIDHVELKHEMFNSDECCHVSRYSLERQPAVAVLLENTTRGTVVMVEQFRYSSLSRTLRNGWTLEVAAGLIEDGEDPLECAKREVLEETGYQIESLDSVMSYFSSVGISNELIHLYYSIVTDADKVESGGGLEAESEDIKVVEVPLADVTSMIKSGDISDGKTIIALQWLALKKAGQEF